MYTVDPYIFTHNSHIKGRWVGRKLIDMLKDEFMLYSKEYYLQAITAGKITINGKIVEPDYRLKDPDILKHTVLREEPYVGDISLIQLLYINNFEITETPSDLMIIYKPSNIAMHPGGAFHKTSLVKIIEYKYNIKANPLHRLDRLTSGILFAAVDAKKHNHLILDGKLQKQYYCLVKGTIDWDEHIVDAPIAIYSRKRSLYTINESGKQSQTRFVNVSCKNNQTLLKAYPLTGRTHQIRLHCVQLGHPIVNDPLYKNGLPSDDYDYSRPSDITKNCDLYLHAHSYTYDGKTITSPVLPEWVSMMLD